MSATVTDLSAYRRARQWRALALFGLGALALFYLIRKPEIQAWQK